MVNRRDILKTMAIVPIAFKTRTFSQVEPLTTTGKLLVDDLKPYVEAGVIKKVYFAGKIPTSVKVKDHTLYFDLGYRLGDTINTAFQRLTGKTLFLNPYSIYKATIIANHRVAKAIIDEQNTLLISGIGFGMGGALLAYLYTKLRK